MNCRIDRVEKQGHEKVVHLTCGQGQQQVVVDEVLIGAGRVPNLDGLNPDAVGVRHEKRDGVGVNDRLQTTNPNIYAAGDICARFKFTHAADAMARIVLRNALFKGRARASALTIPWCSVLQCSTQVLAFAGRAEIMVAYLAWFEEPMKLPLYLISCAVLALPGSTPQSGEAKDAPGAGGTKPDPARVETRGLHNVFRIMPKLYSGSAPDGDEGFRALKDLGVKTIITVDGARPDVGSARKYGMRYVHLPFGYDGIPRDQALRIARAVRDLPGPVYLHCHHGIHRGPTAAAVAHLWLDEHCTVADAVAELRRAGTDPRYTGLYAAPRTLRRPTARELDQVSAEFPEVAKVPALAQAMVGVDDRWENLKRIRSARWKTPRDHPDLVPAHEALQLQECLREAARLDDVRQRPKEFQDWLADAERSAGELESVLRAGKGGKVDGVTADKAFVRAGAACSHCHGRYRDVRDRP